jgi:multidrug transporter EmrE-like cation transporter
MLFNGIALSSMKALNYYCGSEYIFGFFMSLYISSALLGIINVKANFKYPTKIETLIGISLGITLIAGMVTLALTLKYLPGYFVYSAVNGGAVVLISIVAGILFKEKYSIFGILGIITGIIAIIFLSL